VSFCQHLEPESDSLLSDIRRRVALHLVLQENLGKDRNNVSNLSEEL
jgi:hypothetical protein